MIDRKKLSTAVRLKRGGRTLDEAEQESGVPRTVLNRVEMEGSVNADNLMRLCDWLQMPVDFFRARREPATAA